jgi:hypothetical protein
MAGDGYRLAGKVIATITECSAGSNDVMTIYSEPRRKDKYLFNLKLEVLVSLSITQQTCLKYSNDLTERLLS